MMTYKKILLTLNEGATKVSHPELIGSYPVKVRREGSAYSIVRFNAVVGASSDDLTATFSRPIGRLAFKNAGSPGGEKILVSYKKN